jgi:hypothetical protein
MSSLSTKDRVSLCSFTFSDGRRCRTPRLRDNPRFCPYHAQKEARAQAAESLGKDLGYFFSGDYLSACDLSTALGRLIPAVLRGDVKPRAARTVAYLMQTLLQAIHLSKHEYTNAFGSDGWRQSVRNSVNDNYAYRFPPAPQPEAESPQPHPQPTPPPPQPAATTATCHSERSEESAFSSRPAPSPTSAPAAQPAPAPRPAPQPRTPLPPTSSEFAQQVLAGLARSLRPGSTGETGAGQAPQPARTPVETPVNCHPERNEGSSSNSPLVTRHSPLPRVQQSESPTSGPASAPPSAPPQCPVAQPFVSLALPLPIRRRLHRAPA